MHFLSLPSDIVHHNIIFKKGLCMNGCVWCHFQNRRFIFLVFFSTSADSIVPNGIWQKKFWAIFIFIFISIFISSPILFLASLSNDHKPSKILWLLFNLPFWLIVILLDYFHFKVYFDGEVLIRCRYDESIFRKINIRL